MIEAVSYLSLFIQILTFGFFFHELLENKKSFGLMILSWSGVMFSLLAINSFSLLPDTVFEVIRLIMPAAVLQLFFKDDLKKKLFAYLHFWVIYLFSGLTVFLLLRNIFSDDLMYSDGTDSEPLGILAGKLIAEGMMFVISVVIVICVNYRKTRSVGMIFPLVIVLGYTLAYALYLTSYYYINSDNLTGGVIFIQLLFQALLYTMIILQYFNTLKMRRLARMETQAQAADSERHSRERYIALADSKLREITELKSEMVARLSDVRRLMDEGGDGKAADEIMENMSRRLNSFKAVNYCDDHTLNAVLTIKLNEDRVRDINIQTMLKNCTVSGIDNYEMCSLVSNMLDNAVESCLKASDPSRTFIEIKSDIAGGYFVIKVTNSCQGGFDGISVKGEGHGYGMKIVDEICRRHNGEFRVRQKGDTVISGAFLKVDV